MRFVIDNFGNKLFLRSKNAEIFYDYVTKNFDMSDPTISNKVFHTLRVANMCIKLAKKLNLNVGLAYDIGLLHDFGRFNQWQTYKTFNDTKSVDHADHSVKQLFENGDIGMFRIAKKNYKLIELAIKNHNKKEINLSEIPAKDYDKILLYCQLIRDCDKTDIVYRLTNGNINVDVGIEGISPEVIESIKSHKCVDKKFMKTSADQILTLIGYLYDFNFSETLSIIDFSAFWKGIEKHYCQKITNENDQKTLKNLILVVKNYISAIKNSLKETNYERQNLSCFNNT